MADRHSGFLGLLQKIAQRMHLIILPCWMSQARFSRCGEHSITRPTSVVPLFSPHRREGAAFHRRSDKPWILDRPERIHGTPERRGTEQNNVRLRHKYSRISTMRP